MSRIYHRPVASGGAVGLCPPPTFRQISYPSSTREGTLSPSSTMCPPGFSDLATALYQLNSKFRFMNFLQVFCVSLSFFVKIILLAK